LGVLTEIRLRDLLSKGSKEVFIEKGTIVTPAARDFAREAGITLVYDKKPEERLEREEEDGLLEVQQDDSEKKDSREQQYDELIAKVTEITRQKLGDGPIAEEVITKVVSSLMKCQQRYSRANLLATSSGGKGVDVTLPSGGQCTLGLVSLARGEVWQLPHKSLFLVSTGKLKVLPDSQLLGAGDGYQAAEGCQVQALDDSTFFCIQ